MIFGIVSEVITRAKPMIADLFDDPAFDFARSEAVSFGSMLGDMGKFEPARLGPDEMTYTTLQQVLGRLKERFQRA
jgi:fructose 1,6-bisphosphate aldolase/phosphatase